MMVTKIVFLVTIVIFSCHLKRLRWDIPDFGNDSPYLFTPMYEASFKGTKR